MKKILIVGGTGFIGYFLAKKCIRKNWKVTSISTKKPKIFRKIKNVKYLLCDITNKKKLDKILKNKNFNFVVNLGGYVDHSKKIKTFNSHYYGCKNLANIFLKKKINKFVQIGSSVEYGHLKSPQKEKYNPNVKTLKSIYGKAKLMASNLLMQYHKKFNFPVVVLRLYLTYGPKQDINRFIPIIIYSCVKKINFPCSTGSQYRDFIYIDDLTDAIIKSLLSKKLIGEILNIGTGKPKKLKDIIIFLTKTLRGGKPIFGKIKIRKDEIKNLYPDVKKMKKLIKWYPRTEFRNGLLKTINYYKKNI